MLDLLNSQITQPFLSVGVDGQEIYLNTVPCFCFTPWLCLNFTLFQIEYLHCLSRYGMDDNGNKPRVNKMKRTLALKCWVNCLSKFIVLIESQYFAYNPKCLIDKDSGQKLSCSIPEPGFNPLTLLIQITNRL